MPPDVCSIILAAGVGRRMPPDMPPKPCCKVGPLSIIENAFQAYEQAGIFRHVVVVGHHAEEVMAEVCRSRHDVLFACQPAARGTGDAVLCALNALAAAGPPRHVVISAGDKVIEPRVIRGLLEAYADCGCDLCLVAGPAARYLGSGRLVLREGRVCAIIEVPDIKARQFAEALRPLSPSRRPASVGEFVSAASEHMSDTRKLGTYFPALKPHLDGAPQEPLDWEEVLRATNGLSGGFATPAGHVSTEEAAGAELANLSIYAGRFDALLDAAPALGTDNVQGECYFTDVVQILAGRGRKVSLFRIDDPSDVMAFNTMEQLEQVRKVHAERAMARTSYPQVQRWVSRFSRAGEQDPHARAARRLAEQIGPERPCIIVCSPGRVNLMGRHIDHQGGTCNLMAIDREIVIAASPRDDDRVNLWNADSGAYPFRTFTFSELTADIDWKDWLRTLDSQYVQRLVSGSAGDWVNYVKGAALRLQHRYPDRRLRGLDGVVCGEIPVGAGLSSSSALTVAASEAFTELNALNVRPRELVDLCGEAEWFVGTRGGSSDHAAIKLGGPSEIIRVSFFPFEVTGRHPFPPGCSLLVCHSGITAKKTENARDRFNAKVACYHMARELMKEAFPGLAPMIAHLRDVNVRHLDLSLSALYRLIRRLPVEVDARAVERLAAAHPTVAKCVGALKLGEHAFRVRDVALYGLAECERGLRAGDLLDRGEVEALGRMMTISHDGDRVARWRPQHEAFDGSMSDAQLDALVERSSRMEPLTTLGAALWQQPGAYACSLPQIDLMVDRALACEGVLGAQLAGAGLGGCIMVLVRTERVEDVREALVRGYYEPQGVEPRTFVCRPSQGSRVFTAVEGEV